MPEEILIPDAQATLAADRNPASGLSLLGKVIAGSCTVFAIVITLVMLALIALSSGSKTASAQSTASDVTILDKYDMYMTNQISSALDGVLAIKKVYWLSDSDQVAPEPNPACFGEASSPAELEWLLKEAAPLLGGQKLLFSTDRTVWEGAKIEYYYDETILVITWKEAVDGSLYTFSEVKIAHASQFRRFLAGGEFGSDKQYVTTEMAASVNAVVATSGDFYKFRHYGAVVYQGKLERFEGHNVDTCFIDDKGDLLFAYRDQLQTQEDAQKFIEENNVRFSLAFGPVLVENGEVCAPKEYILGEIRDRYSRAAVCQQGNLHYVLVNISQDGGFYERQSIATFAQNLAEMGIQRAYALDGGQTTVISMNGKLTTLPDFGTQRRISDIIYFATALPEGE